MLLHVAAVHTTGINWTSVGTIIGSVLGGMTAVLTALAKWINSRVAEHRDSTAAQIERIANALGGRLDRFESKLDATDEKLDGVNLRVGRLEGPLQRAASERIEG